MAFTGKATYTAGVSLPELVEDVADIIGIVSPFETPLLAHLGDARRPAMSTVHEWIEDSLLPNTDQLNQTVFNPNPEDATQLTVDHGSRFKAGDLVRPEGWAEVMLVTNIVGNQLTVVRGYGGTPHATLADDMKLHIIGNAALEGADAPAARFTSRARVQNYTQIFSASLSVSGTMQAVRAHGIADEADYQKQERLRELLRDLENTVINGVAPEADQQGGSNIRRSMNGVDALIDTNRFNPGVGGFPDGGGASGDGLTEELINAALRAVWEQSSGAVDTILMNGNQKRAFNQLIEGQRQYGPADDRVRSLVNFYESDFGVCRVVVSRWAPSDAVYFLDSSRLQVMPLQGRSFHYKPLSATGDSVEGLLLGEYTLEMKNELAHGVIRGLSLDGN
ncbi:MAG: DUF5309 family protein [Phycisphaerales bacterium]|nr:DUF5309 family protein [Phycisphaerales bacterium]